MFSKYTVNDFKNGPFGLKTFRRNIEHMVMVGKKHKSKVILATFLYHKPHAIQKHGIDFANGWEKGIKLQNEIIRDIAKKNNLILIDLDNIIKNREGLFLGNDFCHFTNEGVAVIAKKFHEVILRYVDTFKTH